MSSWHAEPHVGPMDVNRSVQCWILYMATKPGFRSFYVYFVIIALDTLLRD